MDGASFYDDNDIFNYYMHSRQRAETPNDTIEKTVMLELIRAMQGKHIPLFLIMALRKD